MQQRDKKIDGLKFVLIFFVVLGHLQYDDYGLELNKMIYSFHMPVFVFLSGYLTSLKSDKEKQIAWVKQTAIIFIFAQIGHICIGVFFRMTSLIQSGSISYNHLLSFNDFIAPKFALWYILCLIYWRIMIWHLLPKMNDVLLLFIACILSILVGVIPISETLSFQRAFSFFPFFVLGIVFKKRKLTDKLDKIHLVIPIIIMVIGLYLSRELPLFQPREHYENWNDVVLRVSQSIIGLLLCLSVFRLSRKSKVIEMFSQYGIYTLWIYIGHTFFITIERNILPQFEITYNVFLALIIATFYCSIFIIMAKCYKVKKECKRLRAEQQ